MSLPNKKEIGPILGGAGIFILCTYGAIHQFIYPRSEAEAAIVATNKRIDNVESTQDKDRRELIASIKEIREYILNRR